MIDRQALLKDLQRLLRQLEADLRERCDVPEIGAVVRAEYDKAREADRTALSFEAWRSDYITQIGAAWILSCVFARFLEDNELVDPPKLSGPGERLQRARDEYDLYVHEHPADTVREYLLSVFDALAKLPGAKEVFGGHNLIHQQRTWLSGDAAKELRNFWQQIDPETGDLIHDFADPEWDTRFLGDLYQDLSEVARKKYALLQTPEFVEEFILERTLEPALDEFTLNAPAVVNHLGEQVAPDGFRMIDPACGSGHFLLGSFDRILYRWQKKEPGTNTVELVQRTLHGIHGVDVNPYAVAIARFRLLVAALRACGISRLADAPAFEMNLACGDSLYHGREMQLTLDGIETDESHYFATEDAPLLRRILREGTYHAVVANPPYITPKDRAARNAYRRLYSSCHMKYSLAVPFMERLFRLAIRSGDESQGAGYTGQITANSFMKRQFGKKLIEKFFKTACLTHVIDASGAYIPGHGTPTVILFGRNRTPVSRHIRAAMGITGEPGSPKVPAEGLVWTSILNQLDIPGSHSRFISVVDSERTLFEKHPWSIGGGGVAELKEYLDDNSAKILKKVSKSVGVIAIAGVEEVFFDHSLASLARMRIAHARPFVTGEDVRDWVADTPAACFFPYDENGDVSELTQHENRFLWPSRRFLETGLYFGKSKAERGMQWYEYAIVMKDRIASRSAQFSDVSTHNHFVDKDATTICDQHSPLVTFPFDISDDDFFRYVSFLNSSTTCFWLKVSAPSDRWPPWQARPAGWVRGTASRCMCAPVAHALIERGFRNRNQLLIRAKRRWARRYRFRSAMSRRSSSRNSRTLSG